MRRMGRLPGERTPLAGGVRSQVAVTLTIAALAPLVFIPGKTQFSLPPFCNKHNNHSNCHGSPYLASFWGSRQVPSRQCVTPVTQRLNSFRSISKPVTRSVTQGENG